MNCASSSNNPIATLNDCIEHVAFSTARLKHPKLVWLDKTIYSELTDDDLPGDTAKHFIETYAYSTQTELVGAHLLTSHTKSASAERYGGAGIGTNGGGARCGNIGNIQVKGIGANPLASSKSDLLHRYGGLNLHDAVYECIASTVLNNALPLGCVGCLGIVLTGNHTAYPPYEGVETTKGALLMREVAIRPAHFLPAPHFKPNDNQPLLNDMYRLRKANKGLANNFASQNELILFFGKFLQNCANQFAFAKVFRIYHGTITASNIAIDGRWLDLTTSSFIEGNKNYYFTAHNTPFFDEHVNAIHIIEDLLYQYSKFNLVDLNVAVLGKYYEEQYQAYFNHHFAKVLGFCDGVDAKVTASKGYQRLIVRFKACLFDTTTLQKFTYEHDVDNDPITDLLSQWFTDINHNAKLDPDSLAYSLNVVVKSYYRSLKNSKTCLASFKVAQTIKALRRLYFAPFFYSGKVQAGLREDIEANVVEVEYFGELIESYRDISAQVFDSDDSLQVTIFRHGDVCIVFDTQLGHYQITQAEYVTQVNTPVELSTIVAGISDELLTINYFNFKAPIQKILTALG